LLVLCFLVTLESSAAARQKVMKSKLVTVYFEKDEQLEELADKIKNKAMTRTLNKVLLGKNVSAEQALGAYLDALFQRVQMILEMPLPKLKVNIRIHRNLDALSKFFRQNYGGPNAKQQQMGASVRGPAFYVKRTNTIHLQTGKMKIGILAHEMAHCVTDHYFAVQPPSGVAELMSQYVDKVVSSGRF